MTRRVRRRTHGASTPLAPGLHPVLERVYRARGVSTPADLDVSLSGLAPGHTLLGLDAAVDLLSAARAARHPVLVVGDFDADGATATALALLGLRALGFARVDYLVPNRFEFGYGLTPEIVEVARARAPRLLITVDNGISSIEGVAAARGAGIDVLVTDHHLPGARLPAANAIVNPNQPGCLFPSKNLAGVGVMFYVLAGLRARLREDGVFDADGAPPAPNVAAWLDLVALGTVADVVALDHNNRILVEQGLRRIRAGRCRAGIPALLQAGRRDPRRCVASDLGFAVAPRLNAAGRLTDMSAGIECLLEDDAGRAARRAAELDTLNRERREIESDMHQDAMGDLDALLDGDALPFGLCLFQEHWHQGVVGIVASRVKERVHRPVIAFARENGERLKGSARSIPGVHVRDVLDRVAARHPGLVIKFGGHAMAAGLSIEHEKLEPFRAAFDAELRQLLSPEDLEDVLWTDGALSAGELDLDLARTLRAAGPWGQAFPEPLFDGEFDVLSRRVVGERHLKLRLRAQDGAAPIDAIAFNHTDEGWLPGSTRIRAAYRLDVNEWQARESAQLVVEWLEVVG